MRLAFRFRLIPFIATVLLVVLGIMLGNWQTRRAEEKLAIAARMAERSAAAPVLLDGAAVQGLDRVEPGLHPAHTRELEYRRVRLKGEWLPAWPVFLENRPYNGRAGVYLAMPFRIADSNTHVLVLRGWLPRDPVDMTRLPPFATPKGTVEIEGVVVGSAGHVMQLGTPGKVAPGARVQNLAIDEVASASGLAMMPFFVQQTGPAQPGDALVRDWPLPASGVDKHRGYAFQWYALAAMAALFFVITGFRSGRKHVA